MSETFSVYQKVEVLCRQLTALGDTICPHALAQDCLLIPSTNPVADLSQALNCMLEVHKILYPTLTPAQHMLVITQYNFLVSVLNYLKQAEFVPLPNSTSYMIN